MSVVLGISTAASAEDLIADLVAEAMEKIEGSTPPIQASRIVRREWPDIDPAAQELAIDGLAARIHQELHRERGFGAEVGSESEQRTGIVPRRVNQPPRLIHPMSRLWASYEDASGRQRPFMQFTRADLKKLAEESRAKAGGLLKTARRAEAAESALREYGVERVYELPDEVIRELEEA